MELYINGRRVMWASIDGAVIETPGAGPFRLESAGGTLSARLVGCGSTLEFDSGAGWRRYSDGDVVEVPEGGHASFRLRTGEDGVPGIRCELSGPAAARGSLASLVQPGWFEGGALSQPSAFTNFLSGQTGLVDASGLVLPPLDVQAEWAFFGAFKNCRSLSSAPPGVRGSAGQSACRDMFMGCESLSSVPDLEVEGAAERAFENYARGSGASSAPAVNAGISLSGNYCFNYAFSGSQAASASLDTPGGATWRAFSNAFRQCQGLSYAEISSDGAGNNAYFGAFSLCPSLTGAVVRGANPSQSNAFQQAFAGCSALSDVEVGWTSWDSSRTSNWLSGVSETGVFRCLPTLEIPERSASGVPEGWTVKSMRGPWWRLTVKEINDAGRAYGVQMSEWALYDAGGERLDLGAQKVDAQSYEDFSFLEPGQCCDGRAGQNTNYGEGMENLFDGQTGTKWLIYGGLPVLDNPSSWAKAVIRLPDEAVPASYLFASANDGNPERNPCTWTLENSLDGVDWTPVDSREDVEVPTTAYTWYNGGTAWTLG